jgi:hypothetical protein
VAVGYKRFCRSDPTQGELVELERVDNLAQKLLIYLESSSMAIDTAHVHGASSMAIQSIASALLRLQLGFTEEHVLTPESGIVVRPRPDFYFDLGSGRGILAEVERGGTTTNNHDLKDFWKTHIAAKAHHLFLIVPNSNWSQSGAPREKPFATVARRLGAFFGDPRREVDVLSVHVFGYGRAADELPAALD